MDGRMVAAIHNFGDLMEARAKQICPRKPFNTNVLAVLAKLDYDVDELHAALAEYTPRDTSGDGRVLTALATVAVRAFLIAHLLFDMERRT